jgi:hypothetical protein
LGVCWVCVTGWRARERECAHVCVCYYACAGMLRIEVEGERRGREEGGGGREREVCHQPRVHTNNETK